MSKGFATVNQIAEMGDDIAQAVDADNRKRIENHEIPNAALLHHRLTRWIVNRDDTNLGLYKKPKPRWVWWVLGIAVFLLLWFR